MTRPTRRQWNSTLPAPSRPMPRGTPLRSKKRSASDFARVYGSRKRVAWIKSLPCMACNAISPFFGELTRGKSDNAHTETGGMGYKAGHRTIAPLCRAHHRGYDEHRAPFDTPEAREAAQRYARALAVVWDRYESGLTPLSAIVPGVLENVLGGGGDA